MHGFSFKIIQLNSIFKKMNQSQSSESRLTTPPGQVSTNTESAQASTYVTKSEEQAEQHQPMIEQMIMVEEDDEDQDSEYQNDEGCWSTLKNVCFATLCWCFCWCFLVKTCIQVFCE